MGAAEDDPGLYSSEDLSEEYGILVLDPDGWRVRSILWGRPITHRMFHMLAMESTFQVMDFVKFKALFFMEPLSRFEGNP